MSNHKVSHNSGIDTGNFPGRRRAGFAARKYLKLEPSLTFRQVPHHPEFPLPPEQHTVELAQFLKAVLKEAVSVDFDNDFAAKAPWNDNAVIMMPLPSGSEKSTTIRVEKKLMNEDKDQWLVRRSTHSELDVDFTELDELLRVEHSRNEMAYSPSVFDANMLLTWDSGALTEAASTFKEELVVRNVKMDIFQIFHTMHRLFSGLDRQRDRVYHVLVISAKVPYNTEDHWNRSQSYIIQLPIDIASFRHIESMTKRSHMSKGHYCFDTDVKTVALLPDKVQLSKVGLELVEGAYVSMERLRRPTDPQSWHNQWDKMMRADDKYSSGVSRAGTRSFLTRLIGAEDVYCVFRHIAQQRQAELESTRHRLGGH
ncbi:hypothetical protein P153DRAFT_280301 [Dothidotthia symphoricarpi CBS 119687]|uniref:DUF3074 domain-containing protein n=1 Tax=Dothidotthia symphoricarpi CBS 119687 TaxID=1392245 RepID=A0A6A6AT49_9PLEO|nr:uncharacterized protein P153DRAFT_280301 [Dothidotthia symphoricarpi CBS 119687]KAF2134027.1 hypothetical protein P153DRAFT_280301 [Dothidotthia symphoricarpi CBS 119687]